MPQTHKKEKFYSSQAEKWQLQIKRRDAVNTINTSFCLTASSHNIVGKFCLNILSFAGGAE